MSRLGKYLDEASGSWAFWDFPLGEGSAMEADLKENLRYVRVHALPANGATPVHGTVVVLHGGYWTAPICLETGDIEATPLNDAGTGSMPGFFLKRNFAVVQLEYRRAGQEGGGWPGTNEDILLGLQRLKDLQSGASADPDPARRAALSALALEKLVIVGHSAGGHLALWAATQMARAKPTDPLGSPLKLALCVACAPITDLLRAFEFKGMHKKLISDYMKGNPDAKPEQLEEYKKASPAAMLPVQFPVVLAYGDEDTFVPVDLMAKYVKDAKGQAPSLVREVMVKGGDHMMVFDATNEEIWLHQIAAAMAELAEEPTNPLGSGAARALRTQASKL